MAKENIIIFYGTKWCPDCHRSKKVLRDRGFPFEYVDINRDLEARSFVEQVNHGNRSVPTIRFPNGDVLVEPSNKMLNEKLDTLEKVS